MRNLCFSPKSSPSSSPSSSFSTSHCPPPSRLGLMARPSFSESVMDKTLELVEPMIMKWNPDSTAFAEVTSLFYQNRKEALDFIKCVNNLQKAMNLSTMENSKPEKLIRCQMLMQIAMKRLQNEFYQILSVNRAHLDPESVSTRSSRTSTRSSSLDYGDDDEEGDKIESIVEVEDASTVAMDDLKSITECMISSGYAKECLKIYNITRKSIIDEGIYRLGVEKHSSPRVHKMNWDDLELRIKNWIKAIKVAVKTLFTGERILCDHVFAISDSIRESCFTEITKEGATILFGFPQIVAKSTKRSPEKLFRVLDMYAGISDRWPEIDSIFSFDSTVGIKSSALTSLIRLGGYVRTALNEFESTVQKDSSKSPVQIAGIHNLTIEVMNTLSILADSSNILSDILADSPENSLLENYNMDESPAVSLKFAWLILVLLCKLDSKAENYKDISISYLFLANNLQYVVQRVRTSNLDHLLGGEWSSKHEGKVKQFWSNYERLGWSHVIDALPDNPMAGKSQEQLQEIFLNFNSSFDQAYRKYATCIVADAKLRDEMKSSMEMKIVRSYREFYNMHSAILRSDINLACLIKFTPEDVEHHLSHLFKLETFL